MTTGERLKLRRKEIGFSAEKVADQLGVSPATIYRYEKGDIEKVPVDSLAELAKILQTTPAYLMGMEDAEPTQASLTKAQTSLLSVFDKLNEEGQSKVIEYAEDLHRTGYYKKPAADGLVTKEA